MKRKILLTIILLPFLIVNSVSAAPAADLLNGDFEDGNPPNNWTYEGGDGEFTQLTNPNNGIYCGYVGFESSSTVNIYQIVTPIAANSEVTFSVYAYSISLDVSIQLSIYWLDDINTVLGYKHQGFSIAESYTLYTITDDYTTGDATKIRVHVIFGTIVRQIAAKVSPGCSIESTAVGYSKEFYVDDATLTGEAIPEFMAPIMVIEAAFFMIAIGLVIKIRKR